jgi:hypothetical protein
VNTSSPAQFYLLELLKVLVPVVGIAFIFFATIRGYRASPTRRGGWLCIIAVLWLLLTLGSRLALSVPIRTYFLEAPATHFNPGRTYFAITSWLWTASEIILLVFGVALFIAWRFDRTHLTKR